jgi:hypothetical protein
MAFVLHVSYWSPVDDFACGDRMFGAVPTTRSFPHPWQPGWASIVFSCVSARRWLGVKHVTVLIGHPEEDSENLSVVLNKCSHCLHDEDILCDMADLLISIMIYQAGHGHSSCPSVV